MTNNYNLGDNTIENKIKQKAELSANNIKKKYNDNINIITSQLDTYNGLLVNLKNVIELNKTYKIENNQLFKQLKKSTYDILTNERKTYYENQENDVLNNYYYYILWIIYIFVVIYIILCFLIYPLQNLIVKLFIISLFIFLPFISSRFLGLIIYIIYWLFNLLPKNVYK